MGQENKYFLISDPQGAKPLTLKYLFSRPIVPLL